MASRPTTRSRRAPPAQQQEQQLRAKWTDALTKILVDLMVDEVHKGNRANKSFGKKSWSHMCDEFQKQTGLRWDKEQLKNRWAVLRKQYSMIRSLLDNSDFNWDESTSTIIAKNDEVWDKYIRENPDAETIRSVGCPIYKQLCTIFTEAHMNGKNDNFAVYEGGDPYGFICPEPLSRLQAESSSESEEEAEMGDERERFQPTMPTPTGHRKRGRKGIDDAIANAILEMAAASKLRAAAVEHCNARFSIANCVRALDEMQGVDERIYFAALNLFNSPNARETFLSLKADKRLSWLYWKCNPPSSSMVC